MTRSSGARYRWHRSRSYSAGARLCFVVSLCTGSFVCYLPPLAGSVAAIYSLIESAKLNALNPQHYIADLLARIADHPARSIAELLPWNWQPLDATRAAA